MTTTADALDVYYARMSHSLGDKKTVLPYVTGSRVLDVGCGSGDLMDALTSMGFDTYGLDASQESINRCTQKDRVVLGYADEVVELFGEEFFDTIICSSVLHEVFSYGNRYDGRGKLRSLSNTLKAMRRALKPGGRLVVRDGVAPTNNSDVLMWVDNAAEVDKFLSASPFTKGCTDRHIALTQIMSNVFEGSLSSAMEFAFTYTWGEQSFEREVQEYYGVFNLDNYARFVTRHGFVCEEKFEYLQPGYARHLEGKVSFTAPFPSSNALWIYRSV